jgi:NADP-dependent 3-hydroxy acid dehydrogenase YdfG
MSHPVALITGASSGIGATTARAMARAGHRLVLTARRADELDRLAGELGEDRAVAMPGDVSVWEDVDRAVTAAISRFGRLDVVVANAGFGAPRGWLTSTPEHWRAMIDTNVLGVAYTARAAIPALRESRGHLVLMSSLGARLELPGSLYSVTKHAVTAMGASLRLDLNGTGVRVTVIEPGHVDTGFFTKGSPETAPTFRALDPENVADAIMYAVSQPPHVDVNEILVRPTACDF